MSAPREHESVLGELIEDEAIMAGGMIGTVASARVAADILNSTDPAVHAAMLDALVRAGVLRESMADAANGTWKFLSTEWERIV